jgi:hypothetical protein
MTRTEFSWSSQQVDNPAHQIVVEFLVMDIQNSPEWARDLLSKIDEVRTNKLSKWERNGNAFCVELEAGKAIIEDLVDEDREIQSLPLEEFREAVLAWVNYL